MPYVVTKNGKEWCSFREPPAAKPTRDVPLRSGDIIGFSGTGWQSIGINLATFGIPLWSLSHVGIMARWKDELLLFESTTLDDEPCRIHARKVHGVQAHKLDSRVASYRGGVWHYPLTRQLYSHEESRLAEFLFDCLGRSYDTPGALRSGGLLFAWMEALLRPESLESLFCSELVAAAHSQLGLFPTSQPARWSPSKLVRAERCAGILRKPTRLK